MNTWHKYGLQDANSPIMEQLTFFHDHAMMMLILITISIMYFLMNLLLNKFINRNLMNNQIIEIIWTLIPMLILIILAIPSIHLLYLTDENMKPLLTLKVIGHQWYWSYEYPNFFNMEFETFMLNNSNNNNNNNFRLLDVDNRTIIPNNTSIQLIITSTDVIHSWTIPSIGTKIDAIPGRLNQINIIMNRPGLYFGQCSEICGANHSFMPIVMESIPMNYFLKWTQSFNL
uniref:Cytochrome c oxidase subunit 2 n=1 Tax=Arge aurora TaxID=2728854 RepID=A0A6M5U843_9HYME|nr:cytochrome c oxidase subunit II [Arge aurora]